MSVTLSPPLIVAVVASAALAAAVTALHGFRWMERRRRRMLDHQRYSEVVPPDDGEDLEPPRLWDLGGAPGVIRHDCGWKDMMPVAALSMVHVPAKGRVDQRQSLPRPLFAPCPEMVEEGRLQVAVSIAMPCPHQPRLLTSTGKRDGKTAVSSLVYAIGLLDVSCRKLSSSLDGR